LPFFLSLFAGSACKADIADNRWKQAAAKLELFRASPEEFETEYGFKELARLDGPWGLVREKHVCQSAEQALEVATAQQMQ
jgi:hypothetical protein